MSDRLSKYRNDISAKVDEISNDILDLTKILVSIPSINHPPKGDEAECQQFVANYLERIGLGVEKYLITDVADIKNHPAWWGTRDYSNRPNVAAKRSGQTDGRSLVLSGHIDTVPLGLMRWDTDPFTPTVKDGKLYGLGAFDMKSGVAAAISAMRIFQELDIPLAGDLMIETVIDEEFGGVNGTLAGRLRGYVADAMIVTEPSGLNIWNGDRGGRTAHLTFRASEGIAAGEVHVDINSVDQLTLFLSNLDRFRATRRKHVDDWGSYAVDPVPAWVTKIFAGGWGNEVPQTVPAECKVELYWQLQPGESQADVDGELLNWLQSLQKAKPELFPELPEIIYPIRWMPGSVVPPSSDLVQTLKSTITEVTGCEPNIDLADGPSDSFVVNRYFDSQAVMFGARGGNAHAANEYVIVEDLVKVTKTLAFFALDWCGISGG